MQAKKCLQQAVRLSRLQVAAFGKTTEERCLYLCAISVFDEHIEGKVDIDCTYLLGVFDLVRKLDSQDDPDLGLATWHTLGLVADGAEWESRLNTARQELIDNGVSLTELDNQE